LQYGAFSIMDDEAPIEIGDFWTVGTISPYILFITEGQLADRVNKEAAAFEKGEALYTDPDLNSFIIVTEDRVLYFGDLDVPLNHGCSVISYFARFFCWPGKSPPDPKLPSTRDAVRRA